MPATTRHLLNQCQYPLKPWLTPATPEVKVRLTGAYTGFRFKVIYTNSCVQLLFDTNICTPESRHKFNLKSIRNFPCPSIPNKIPPGFTFTSRTFKPYLYLNQYRNDITAINQLAQSHKVDLNLCPTPLDNRPRSHVQHEELTTIPCMSQNAVHSAVY